MRKAWAHLIVLGLVACGARQRATDPPRLTIVEAETGSPVLSISGGEDVGALRSGDVAFSWLEQDLGKYCAVAVGAGQAANWWISTDCRIHRTQGGMLCFADQVLPRWGTNDGRALRVSGCVSRPRVRAGAWRCGTGVERERDTISVVLRSCWEHRDSKPCAALRPSVPLRAQCEDLFEPRTAVPDGGWWALDHVVNINVRRWDRRLSKTEVDGGQRVCWEASECEPAELQYRWSRCWFDEERDDAGNEVRSGHCERRADRAVQSDGCEEPFALALDLPPPRSQPPDMVEQLEGGVWIRRTFIHFDD